MAGTEGGPRAATPPVCHSSCTVKRHRCQLQSVIDRGGTGGEPGPKHRSNLAAGAGCRRPTGVAGGPPSRHSGTNRSEAEGRRGAADVRQHRVHVLISGHIVEDPEAEMDRPSDDDGREPGEAASFDLLLDADLRAVQPGPDVPGRSPGGGQPAGPPRQETEAEAGALHGSMERLEAVAPAHLLLEVAGDVHRGVHQAAQPPAPQGLQAEPEFEPAELPGAFQGVMIEVEAVRLGLEILFEIARLDLEAAAQAAP